MSNQAFILDNHSSYVDRYGLLRVVGEIENTGDADIESIRITANFYDLHGSIVAVGHTSAMLHTLPPQTRSPFKVTLAGSSPDLISRIDHYTLNATCQESKTKLARTLLLLSVSNYTDRYGLLHIVGELQNNGTRMSTFTEVIATCYDENSKVVAANSGLANPQNLDPGEKATFEIIVTDENIVPYEIVIIDKAIPANISRYEVMIVSKDAVLVPEFSSIPAVMFFVCLLTLTILGIGTRLKMRTDSLPHFREIALPLHYPPT
ncbi:MAG: FxLYD domain-containing protein [Candidatus Bathyarchaeia archaeon]